MLSVFAGSFSTLQLLNVEVSYSLVFVLPLFPICVHSPGDPWFHVSNYYVIFDDSKMYLFKIDLSPAFCFIYYSSYLDLLSQT